jgi:hypothetical protein
MARKRRWPMKRLLFLFVLLMSMLILLTAGSVYAQIRMQVEVPFTFTLMDKVFVADTYSVMRPLSSSLDLIQVRSRSSQAFLRTTYLKARPNLGEKPKFVFRRYGDQYFLAQVWLGGEVGHEIRKCNSERQIAKLGSEPERIYIAAK